MWNLLLAQGPKAKIGNLGTETSFSPSSVIHQWSPPPRLGSEHKVLPRTLSCLARFCGPRPCVKLFLPQRSAAQQSRLGSSAINLNSTLLCGHPAPGQVPIGFLPVRSRIRKWRCSPTAWPVPTELSEAKTRSDSFTSSMSL